MQTPQCCGTMKLRYILTTEEVRNQPPRGARISSHSQKSGLSSWACSRWTWPRENLGDFTSNSGKLIFARCKSVNRSFVCRVMDCRRAVGSVSYPRAKWQEDEPPTLVELFSWKNISTSYGVAFFAWSKRLSSRTAKSQGTESYACIPKDQLTKTDGYSPNVSRTAA